MVITLAEVGGAQSYVMDLLPALTPDLDVTVAAHGEGPLVAAAVAAGAAYIPLEHVRRPISPLEDVRGLLELWSLCRRLRPDIVHANSSKAGVLARFAAALAGVPVRVFTAHGWAFKAGHGQASRLYLWADRVVRPLTSAVVCVSEEERRVGVAAGTCSRAATAVIPNGVDATAIPQRRHAAVAPVRVVSVGRLAEPKDFSTLVRAVVDLPVDVTVFGDGPLRQRLEREIAAAGVEDRFTLAGEIADVRSRLATFDVFVLSSRSEGLPISLLEAGAAGLPAVASAVGGVAEAVEEGVTGFLVPPGDAAALRERLRQLVDDVGLRKSLGTQARRRIEERFSIETTRVRHLDLYRRLVSEAAA